jgi:transcriptional regulator with XRE-family HTH domain
MRGRKKDKIPPDNEFAKRFDALIGKTSNKKIADLSGLKPGTIGNYRKGRIPLTISIQQLVALCRALGVTSDELLFGEKLEVSKIPFLKISCEIIKTNGIRQVLLTATPTKEGPPQGLERRKKSEIYIDLP